MMRQYLPLSMIVLLGLFFAVGCGGQKGVSADPDKARAILKEGLEAWQKGETPEALKMRTNIIMADKRWTNGDQLVSFEIPNESDMLGFDWQCKVKTVTKNKDGKQKEEKATYCVSTAPNLVVVRN